MHRSSSPGCTSLKRACVGVRHRRLRCHWPSALLITAATSIALPAHAGDPAPLTMAEAQAIALDRSQALPAQEHAASAARERAVAAAQRPDPILRVGLDNVPIGGSTEHLLTREAMTARSIGISQALPDAGKRNARALVFEREAAQAQARKAVERRGLLRETALAWWALRAELQRSQIVGAQRVEAELVRDAAEAAWRAGRGAQADLFTARGALARVDDQRLQVQMRADVARVNLQRWIGAAAERVLAQPPAISRTTLADHIAQANADASAGSGSIEKAASIATATATATDKVPALDEDPELLWAAAREAVAQAAAQAAREDWQADWSVDLRFAQRGPRFDNMITLGVSMPLRWDQANRQDRELAARAAMLQQLRAETDELRRARDAEVLRWHQRWRNALARLAGYDKSLLPLAADRVRAAVSAYGAGSGALQSVLDARVAEQGLRLERVQIELDAASDWTRLETLIPEAAPLTAAELENRK